MKIGYLMQVGVRGIRTPPYSGPANHVVQVIEELRKRGHQVRLLTWLDGKTLRSDHLEVFEPVTVKWMDQGPLRLTERMIRRVQSELRLPYLTFFESMRFALACRQELRGHDLLYERITWSGYGGGLAARWLDIPLVLEENGNQLSMMDLLGNAPQGAQRRLEVSLMNRAVKQAAHVVASGDGWRQHFIERFAVDPGKVTTIENGTNLLPMLQRANLSAFRPMEDLTRAVTLVYLGGFFPWHGVTILLNATARATHQGVPLRLLLIGAGPGLDDAKQLATKLGIGDLVTFTGHLPAPEFARLLAESDIGLAPYCGWVEFSGLKLLDYKAAGLAVIASGMDGQPAVITPGETGLIVPPCDEDALCNAIVQLATETDLRRQMGQQARIEAERYHGWDHTAQELERLFLSLMQEYRRS
jgi:glycosyltransferase involved in cell wall biosynthesis